MKAIAPVAINALKEALTNIYWYKSDLKTFLRSTLNDLYLLSKLNWDAYKRNIVGDLVDHLARNQNDCREELLNLILEVIKIKDFSHLRCLDDGDNKAKRAKESVSALKELTQVHEDIIIEKKKREKRKEEVYKSKQRKTELRKRLDDLKEVFFDLVGCKNTQKRGYALEKILKELFDLFDLDPKASFKITGEQIDGAFTFESTDFLFEARWQKEPVDAADLYVFEGKLKRKLDNTLGLFLSIDGFSGQSIDAYSKGRSMMILMDGKDLTAVLEDRIDLKALLLRKKKHAAQTGNIFLRVDDIL